jgi:hypothetical protein
MPLMPHGFVTSAKLEDGKITFSVGLYDFQSNEPVEISGHATQSGGAFANIYQIAQVPATGNGPKGEPSVDVTVEPLSAKKFRQNEDVIVTIHAAKVWVTVLGAKTGQEVTQPDGSATWDVVRVVSQLNGDSGSSGGY